VIPQLVAEGLGELSRWMLLVAIAAVGMKTSLRRILEAGGQAITLIVAETVFIAELILIGIVFLA
ncbi:MAG: putative sulfate exporter family transporter, partial [Pseudomonadota bacterium]|nr:putative sulfate exporter family transporter [Pseudomonadota bacterium]